MGRLNTMQDKVEAMLRKHPRTRDDDRLLIGAIYTTYYDVDVRHEPFASILLNDRLPSFETIRRCRQKAQSENEELRGKKDKERLERQREFVEYAKGE